MSKELALGLDSRVAGLNDQFTNYVKLSGQQYTEVEYTPDGSDFSSQIQWQSIVPVGSITSTVMSRVISMRYNISVGITPAAQNAITAVLPNTKSVLDTAGVNAGLRAFPLQSVSDTVQVYINNSCTTWNSRITLPNLLRSLKLEELKSLACPSRPDNACMLLPANGYACQPLSLDNQSNEGFSRNSIRPISVVANGNQTVYTFQIEENLIVPGINSLYGNECFLPNVNNLSVMLNYSSLSDVVSYSALPTPINSTLAVVVSQPKLVLRFLQLDPNLVKIPRSYITNYENMNWFYSSQTQAVANTVANVSYTITSDTFRLTSVPKLIMFSLRPSMATRTQATPDCAMALDNLAPVSINFGNRSGLLANANSAELYRMAKQNGSNQSFYDWQKGAGAYVVLDPVKDFGLNPEVDGLPGESNSLNLQITAKFNNQNLFTNQIVVDDAGVCPSFFSANSTWQMIVMVIYSGQMTITPDQCIYSTQTLTAGEVKSLVDGKSPMSTEAINKTMDGKGLYSEKTVFHKTKGKGGVLSSA